MENIVGTWVTTDTFAWLWSFRADGTLLWANPTHTDDGRPDDGEPYQTFELDSGTMSVYGSCVWELDIWADGTMRGVKVDGPGDDCVPGELWDWGKLSPAPGVVSLDLETVATPPPRAPVELYDVSHAWWLQESGHLLIITLDMVTRARYMLDDDGDLFTDPDDVGAATITEAGAVTLTSSGTTSCPAGARVTLDGELVQVDGESTGLVWSWETDADAGGCAVQEGLGGTWVAVS